MTSTDNREWVDNIVAVNGGSEGYTHIIEYQNQFDGRTAWKLCKSEGIFVYAMAAPALIDPKLIWSKHGRMEP